MDIRKIKKLIELVEESGITELEVQEEEGTVRISRAAPAVAPALQQVGTFRPQRANGSHTGCQAAAAPSTSTAAQLATSSSTHWTCSGSVLCSSAALPARPPLSLTSVSHMPAMTVAAVLKLPDVAAAMAHAEAMPSTLKSSWYASAALCPLFSGHGGRPVFVQQHSTQSKCCAASHNARRPSWLDWACGTVATLCKKAQTWGMYA